MLKILKYSISKSSKLLFLGSDNFAYHPLVSLHSSFPNLDVVTHHTQPTVKSINKVQQFCQTHSISYSTPIHKSSTKPERTNQWSLFREQIKDKNYALGIICSYGFMIPSSIIKCFSEGIIVIHPSLLPKYRGGAPIFHAIANGDKETGVSFIEISVGKFDAGRILYQTRVEMGKDDEYLEVEEMLSKNAAENVVRVVQELQKLKPGREQGKEGESKAPIVIQKCLQLEQSSEKVYNLSRAIKSPRVKFGDKEIIVKLIGEYVEVESNQQGDKQVGRVFKKGKKVFIVCGDGRAVRMFEWKQPSKTFLPASAFANQYLKNGSVIFT